MTPEAGNSDPPDNIVEFPRERRAGARVLEAWERARGDAASTPLLSNLGLARDAELTALSFVLHENIRIRDSVFIQCGAAVSLALSSDSLGQTLGDMLPKEIAERIMAAADRARAEGRPAACDGDYRRADGTEMKYRALFTPARSAMEGSSGQGYLFGTFGERDFSAEAA